tara:strand:- start:2060 stop:2464 length:405 start_codon:yes stop_codon:yes gene_type:complete
MKLKVMQEVEIDAAKVRIEFSPRYMSEEDCAFNENTPMLENGVFSITYNIETGAIDGWPKDEPMEIHEKVVDGGSYYLLDSEGNELASIIENYVPSCITNDYGDYLIINIDTNGVYANRQESQKVRCFFDSDED